jgi:GT2 family glycosyltransferase
VVAHAPGNSAIYVADNGSTDESEILVHEKFPTVRWIDLQKNYGFAAGYNKALAQIDAEYFVLLNSDVEVTAGWTEPILEILDSDPTIAACQPKILSYDRKNEFEYAGASGGFIDKWGYPFCRGRIFYVYENDQNQYDDPGEVFWASGAALFIKSDLYRLAGGLDEDFFAHMEEIDLCWRLKNMGYKVYVQPRSTVYHIGGGTMLMGTPRKTFLNFRNNLVLLSKNLPKRAFMPLLVLRLFLDGIAALSFLPHKNGFGNFLAVVKAHLSYYSHLPRTLSKRARIPKQSVSCIYQGSVVVAFYLKNKRKFSHLQAEFSSGPQKNIPMPAGRNQLQNP